MVGCGMDFPAHQKPKNLGPFFLGSNFPTGLFMGCRSALCGCNDKIHGGGVRGGNGFTYWLVGGVGIGVQEPNIYSQVPKIFLACRNQMKTWAPRFSKSALANGHISSSFSTSSPNGTAFASHLFHCQCHIKETDHSAKLKR